MGDLKNERILLAAALAYAAKGIPVFPCKSDKAPRVKGGHKAATADADQIRRWWTKWPDASIGIPTGKASGIVVLDLDYKPEKDKNGLKEVSNWESRSNVIARTQSGGAHLYFFAGGAPRTSVDELAVGVDTRGDGAYVIAPPSKGYEWVAGRELGELRSLRPWPSDMLLEERPVGTANDVLEAEDFSEVDDALAIIPNDDVSWGEWNRVAMATFAATGGHGLEAFDLWSQKSSKYDAAETQKKWQRLVSSPPNGIGAGTLFHMANEIDPGWRMAKADEMAAAASASADDYIDAQLREKCAKTIIAPHQTLISAAELQQTATNTCEVAPTIERPLETSAPEAIATSDAAINETETKAAAETIQENFAPSSGSLSKPAPRLNARKALLTTNAGFLKDFRPPDYLIYGLVQRGFIYSMTAPTGTGKTAVLLLLAAMVALGQKLGDREVEQGRVLFLAGENPDDVRMRWIKQAEEMKIDHDKIDIVWRDGRMNLIEERAHLDQETTLMGPFSLVVVDTSAAFFSGKDENSNPELGNFARQLRSLTQLRGGPTVIVSCHPTKNPDMDNLLPRGGGAFLAEVDGNFACRRVSGNGNVVELVAHGKFRGPDFPPISFSINPGTTALLKDSKQRPIWTVTARVLNDDERAKVDDSRQRREEDLLIAMADNPAAPYRELAEKLGWMGKAGDPLKSLISKLMKVLEAKKMIKKGAGDRRELTRAGHKEAERARAERQRM